MKKFIEVHDDVLPQQIQNFIEDITLNSPNIPLYYTGNIASNSSEVPSPGFANVFYDSLELKILPFTSIFLKVIYSFSNFRNLIIENLFLGRIFLHLPSPNPGPDTKHIDLKIPHWVCLYYINDSEGDTILFDEDEREIQRITPKKGRIVFFDGSITHCSTRPSSKTRAILNFDFLGKSIDNT